MYVHRHLQYSISGHVWTWAALFYEGRRFSKEKPPRLIRRTPSGPCVSPVCCMGESMPASARRPRAGRFSSDEDSINISHGLWASRYRPPLGVRGQVPFP